VARAGRRDQRKEWKIKEDEESGKRKRQMRRAREGLVEYAPPSRRHSI